MSDTLLLQARGVRVLRGARAVVDGVDLTLARGDRVAIVGANGSGKSTLLRALLGLEPLAAGEVLLEGASVRAMPRVEIARRATLVLQDTHVDVPITVRELVELGRFAHRGTPRSAEDRAELARALRETSLEDLATRDLRTLSGGELQRAHLARALAQACAVVLCDEPTSSLDLRHQLAVLATLRAQADAGRAVVVVLHDLTLAARWAERVLVLREGRVLAEGAPRAVLTRETLREAFDVEVRVSDVESDLVITPLSR